MKLCPAESGPESVSEPVVGGTDGWAGQQRASRNMDWNPISKGPECRLGSPRLVRKVLEGAERGVQFCMGQNLGTGGALYVHVWSRFFLVQKAHCQSD